ncbi:MAG: hypothetical protein ACREP1_08775 [Rhodanobacteraceae bacterium]
MARVPFDEYLRGCGEQADVVRKKLAAAGMTGRVTKQDLLELGRAKGLRP